MYFGYRYGVGEEALFGAVASLMGIPSFLIQVAVYVFSALALYTIAKRRGLTDKLVFSGFAELTIDS